MNKEEGDAQTDRHRPHDKVSDTKERILASQPRRGGENHLLSTTKLSHWVGIVDKERIVACGQTRAELFRPVDDAVKLENVGSAAVSIHTMRSSFL